MGNHETPAMRNMDDPFVFPDELNPEPLQDLPKWDSAPAPQLEEETTQQYSSENDYLNAMLEGIRERFELELEQALQTAATTVMRQFEQALEEVLARFSTQSTQKAGYASPTPNVPAVQSLHAGHGLSATNITASATAFGSRTQGVQAASLMDNAITTNAGRHTGGKQSPHSPCAQENC